MIKKIRGKYTKEKNKWVKRKGKNLISDEPFLPTVKRATIKSPVKKGEREAEEIQLINDEEKQTRDPSILLPYERHKWDSYGHQGANIT